MVTLVQLNVSIDGRERAVIKALKENGKLQLTKLRAVTGIPSASLHRVIGRLEWQEKIRSQKIKKIRMVELVNNSRQA